MKKQQRGYINFINMKARQAEPSQGANTAKQKGNSKRKHSEKGKTNSNNNKHEHGSKRVRIQTPEKKQLSHEEYNKLCAKLAKKNPNDPCTLRPNYKYHKTSDCV